MIEGLSLQKQPLTFQNIARDLLSIQKLINTGIIKQEEIRATSHSGRILTSLMNTKSDMFQTKTIDLSLPTSLTSLASSPLNLRYFA